MIGVCIGAIEGGTIGQIVGGQIGRISIELEHSASICPFTQRQTQLAFAKETKHKKDVTISVAAAFNIFIF